MLYLPIILAFIAGLLIGFGLRDFYSDLVKGAHDDRRIPPRF